MNLMRIGYAVMGVGLAVVKWPLLDDVHEMPLWLALVAVPAAAAGNVSSEVQEVVVSCSLAVIVLAVLPWRHVWQRFATIAGDPWR